MKPYITQDNSRSQRHAERLNRAIEVLVIDRVLVMPDSRGGVSHLVADERNTIDPRSRLDRIGGRSRWRGNQLRDTGRRGGGECSG